MTPSATLAPPRSANHPDIERIARDRALFADYSNGAAAVDRDAVIERFLPLARQLALRYVRPSEPFDDIYQVACLALVKAVDRYDARRGVAFSSYAVPTIVGEIKRYYRDRTWAVHVARDLLEAALKVERAADELSLRLGRRPTVPEIAERVGMSDEDVLEAREAGHARRTASIDEPRGPRGDDESATLGEALGGEDGGYALAEHRVTLGRLLGALSARDREIVRLRFAEDLTQDEIGRRMGISQMQVSRVLRLSLDRLRAAAAG